MILTFSHCLVIILIVAILIAPLYGFYFFLTKTHSQLKGSLDELEKLLDVTEERIIDLRDTLDKKLDEALERLDKLESFLKEKK